MQTVLDIPDQTAQKALHYARAKRISSSELYTQAINDYLAKLDNVTERLNAVYDEHDTSSLDPKLHQLQMVSLPTEDWS